MKKKFSFSHQDGLGLGNPSVQLETPGLLLYCLESITSVYLAGTNEGQAVKVGLNVPIVLAFPLHGPTKKMSSF